ncbi:uncharacterized protein PFL1_06140 [Pseudozyma flocculosa PF-1]|uniref:Related to UPF0261 domain protein n=2 Tax=Pseudozyma flocculosa TaxID=84751 RepID=A0A5C3F6S1_9BASI|nr:uncharacterized protein PFL1_06140 [Pseudozyma flocculosa PF-1]EPQ26205.1 hypothetical protein PFL1_06140 [Pseudozyma flocculosa PF-1]SPO40158.1 related to UPF0261 domain protein [Pseudozyma flocculosa]
MAQTVQTDRAHVALIGTLDTKQAEYAFAAQWLAANGCSVTILDVSTRLPFSHLDELPALQHVQTVSPLELFSASSDKHDGATPAQLKEQASRLERHDLRAALVDGCLAFLRARLRSGSSPPCDAPIDAIASFGGSQNTSFACTVMRNDAFKLGLPKFCLTTMASGDISQYIGESDICLMPSVGDISGSLNKITRTVLMSASAAIAGMANAYHARHTQARGADADDQRTEDRPLIAVSMFGVTTPCVTAASEALKRHGLEPVAFHATGTGGRTMERLIRENYFAGVLDLTTTEICDDLFSGVLSAGPDRLVSSASTAVPTVVSVGALDMINFGPLSSLPPSLEIDAKEGAGPLHVNASGRKVWEHNESVSLLRTTPDENRRLGESVVERLMRGLRAAKSEGRKAREVKIVLPLHGVSMLDKQGEAFDDREARQALFDAIESSAARAGDEAGLIKIIKVERHINDPEFAEMVADLLVRQLQHAS